MQPLAHEVCGKIDEYERDEQQLSKQKEKRMAILRNDHILAFSEVFKASVTSWNFFNVCFAMSPQFYWVYVFAVYASCTSQ